MVPRPRRKTRKTCVHLCTAEPLRHRPIQQPSPYRLGRVMASCTYEQRCMAFLLFNLQCSWPSHCVVWAVGELTRARGGHRATRRASAGARTRKRRTFAARVALAAAQRARARAMPLPVRNVVELARQCRQPSGLQGLGASFDRVYRVRSGQGAATLSPELCAKYGVGAAASGRLATCAPVQLRIAVVNGAHARSLPLDPVDAGQQPTSRGRIKRTLQRRRHSLTSSAHRAAGVRSQVSSQTTCRRSSAWRTRSLGNKRSSTCSARRSQSPGSLNSPASSTHTMTPQRNVRIRSPLRTRLTCRR